MIHPARQGSFYLACDPPHAPPSSRSFLILSTVSRPKRGISPQVVIILCKVCMQRSGGVAKHANLETCQFQIQFNPVVSLGGHACSTFIRPAVVDADRLFRCGMDTDAGAPTEMGVRSRSRPTLRYRGTRHFSDRIALHCEPTRCTIQLSGANKVPTMASMA